MLNFGTTNTKRSASIIFKKKKIFFFFFFPFLKFITYKLKGTYYTEWNNKIVVLKKTTLQLYFKTFIEKVNSGNLIM